MGDTILPMKFILLTHSRELSKPTNTGQLIQRVIADTLTIIWQRKQPDPDLLEIIQNDRVALVYPAEDTVAATELENFDYFILIDSTWQEARKIYNHSPYLYDIPCVQISATQKSSYQLRRNQREGGLCTAECAIELLRQGRLDSGGLEKAYQAFVDGDT